jgi:aryl-alcohol dehydrogenase-like predicted oxidoreductase
MPPERDQPIPRRPFGRTGLEVSVVGFGAASYWGMKLFSEQQAIRLVREAVERGVNLFDTGSSYSGGNAEPRLGRALAGLDRSRLVISSKVGTRLGGWGRYYKDFRPAQVRSVVEQSLRNLSLERLPLLHLHGPSLEHLRPELLDCLESLRDEGLVRFLGVNSFEPEVIARAGELDLFDSMMIDYNILRMHWEPQISGLARAGKGVLAAGALANAVIGNRLLEVRGPRDVWYVLRALRHRRRDLVRGMSYRFIAGTPGWSASQAALGFVLANSEISAAMVGTTSSEHLRENLSVASRQLPRDLVERIRAVDAATPRPG